MARSSTSSQPRIGVAVIGGTGYAAGELLRLLCQHPLVEVCSIISSSRGGEQPSASHPQLEGFYGDLRFTEQLDWSCLESFGQRVVFSALPHGASGEVIAGLFDEAKQRGLKIIDLSGDLRLRDEALRHRFYPEAKVEQSLQKNFVYGLPELYREQIKGAQFVSNPGCSASGCILAAAPLIDEKYQGSICFNSGCGTSGAGKDPKSSFHHPHRHGNAEAYKVLEHRHEPEVYQALGDARQERLSISFVPFLLTSARGIYATAQLSLDAPSDTERLLQHFGEFYADSPFVRLRRSAPDIHAVVGSNFCDITVKARGRQVVSIAALDNMVKGTAGLAIQNMNLMCGLAETTGLWLPGLGPI